MERWQSGLMRLSRKQMSPQGLRQVRILLFPPWKILRSAPRTVLKTVVSLKRQSFDAIIFRQFGKMAERFNAFLC